VLKKLDSTVMDGYVTQHRAEWADDRCTRHVSDHTIAKELATLRAALKRAKRRKLWKGDLDEVMPSAADVSADYKPRKRWLRRTNSNDCSRNSNRSVERV
jgi:hypothetical protein